MYCRLLVACSLLVLAAGCQQDVCVEAAAHYSQCIGHKVSAQPNCNEAAAEMMLAQPCWALGSGGKMDGADCAVVKCPETVVVRQGTVKVVPSISGTPISGLAFYAQSSDVSDRARLVVISDTNVALTDGETMSDLTLEQKLTASSGQARFSRVGAGSEVRFKHADKSYRATCVSVERITEDLPENPTGNRKRAVTHVTLEVAEAEDDDKLLKPSAGESVLLDGLLAPNDQLSFQVGTNSYVFELDKINSEQVVGKVTRCGSLPCVAGGESAPVDGFSCPVSLTTPGAPTPLLCVPDGRVALWYKTAQIAGCGEQPSSMQVKSEGTEVADCNAGSVEASFSATIDTATGKVVISHDKVELNAVEKNTIEVELDTTDQGTEGGLLAGTLRAYEGHQEEYSMKCDSTWDLKATVSGLAPGIYAVKLYGPGDSGRLTKEGATVAYEAQVTVPPASTTPDEACTAVRLRAFGSTPAVKPAPTTASLLPVIPAPTIDKATGKVTVKGEVKNQGQAKSTATNLVVTLVKSDGSTEKVKDVPVPEVAANGTHPWPLPLEMTLDPGDYSLQGTLASQAAGTADTKFTVPARSTTTTPKAKADLTIIMPQPTIDTATGKVVVNGTVCNRGSVASPVAKMQVILTDASNKQLLVKNVEISALTTATGSNCAQWAAQEIILQAGTYVASAKIDPTDGVKQAEMKLSFEVSAGTAASGQIDLQVETMTPQRIGAQIKVTIRVCNKSAVVAPAFRAGIFLNGSQPQCNQAAVVAMDYQDGLQPNECLPRTSQLFSPGAATTVWALADMDCKVTEGNETNNAKSSVVPTATRETATPTVPVDQNRKKLEQQWGIKGDDGGCQIGGSPSGDLTLFVVLALIGLAARRRRSR